MFAREIHTKSGTLGVGALSGVCTHEQYRSRGFAAQTVRAAFARVDQGLYPVSLWMTTVPGFYEKLGARVIHSTWVNGKNPDNPTADPWPDEVKMIYPASYPWSEGVMDLNGGVY
ncbi:MAG: GNAT family N-acetyltransferase [Anaerolineae bacterium]|nr:GNAT family N-acetyltransferase [Anaerolineae bacterium]